MHIVTVSLSTIILLVFFYGLILFLSLVKLSMDDDTFMKFKKFRWIPRFIISVIWPVTLLVCVLFIAISMIGLNKKSK